MSESRNDICSSIVNQIRDNLSDILDLRDQITKKEDDSYVSEGDLLVQDIVFRYIREHLPEHELISEELARDDQKEWNEKGSYVILDPIDGTENFISGLKEWGVGICIFTDGKHEESCIFLPELDDVQISGMPMRKYTSRIRGLSSSLKKDDLMQLPEGYEYRIIGCSMYNMLSAVRGSYDSFENVRGVHCWDVLPGLNLALEHGCPAYVDGKPYRGELLFPVKKYKIKIQSGG